MGYFSKYATAYPPIPTDHSHTPPHAKLLWRLDALERQLERLRKQTCHFDSGACFDRQALRYAPAGSFLSVTDVLEAMELVILELEQFHGIRVRKDPQAPITNDPEDMQITILDLLLAQAFRALKA